MVINLLKSTLSLSILASILMSNQAFAEEEQKEEGNTVKLETIVVQAAKDELKQAAGLSIIGKETLEKQPVANDISEIVRTMPGVNLSGSSTSGQRGNQRQIDLRGMGPDNTLILIDGRPVTSRMSVRPGRTGEKDTRGDSQWVPPSSIERIEVLRGPAAARYGSGSMGGVVNIITKSPTQQEASITGHYELPESNREGSSWRTGINLAGPINDQFSYRTTLGYHKSEGDDPYINKDATTGTAVPAGREGVENIDVRQLIEYALNNDNTVGVDINYSQQANRWAGDSLFQGVNEKLVDGLAGKKTNEMQRYGVALTHKGEYDGSKSNSYIEYNRTNNSRLGEGLFGGGEGQINTDNITNPQWSKTKYETLNAKSEWDVYFDKHTLTTGAEFRGEKLYNPTILSTAGQAPSDFGSITPNPSKSDLESDAYLIGAYVEDNYQIAADWYLTPGLRFDYHSKGGTNWSPSLNTTWQFSENWSVKGGVSRAFKAPSLYQLDPNYLYYTGGNGCPSWVPTSERGCYVLGNPDLENETSWNKEITFTYADDIGLTSGLTYYRNDYDNRVAASYERLGTVHHSGGTQPRSVFLLENQGEAVIEGIEAFLQIPVTDYLKWNYNVTGNLRSERKDNKEPLSLIPKYTINTSLDWDITDNWNSTLSASFFGKIKAPKRNVNNDAQGEATLIDRESYALVNFHTNYKLSDHFTFGLGVKNLLDKDISREGSGNNAGARTFNEPGRLYTFDVKFSY